MDERSTGVATRSTSLVEVSITVTGLAYTAVKGTRLRELDAVELGPDGVPGNRRFFLIDRHERMVNGKTLGELSRVLASYADGELRLELPDGQVVADVVNGGDPIVTRFYSDSRPGRIVRGPWAQALSSYLGQPVRLVEGDGVDRGQAGAASLISRASLARLASEAGADAVDARRFRMLIEIDGVAAHAEDAWIGRSVRIGSAVVRFAGNVGRCLVTSRDPDSGQIDLPTLDLLRAYRGDVQTTEPLPFGIYGSVVEGGMARLGDAVEPI
jgi:uncharacterized protein YcbX